MPTDRYVSMPYRRCGTSGLRLPAISLGLWQGMGSYRDDATAAAIINRAFDHGITHFDLANNYGNPAGASESLFGRLLKDLPRDELVVTSKAGYRMWPGPYGDGGSRKYLISSCEASLKRLNLPYVDIFYLHRFDADTPLEESIAALAQLVRQGKALYAGVSSFDEPHLTRAVALARAEGLPLIAHQPRYNLLHRAIESQVLPTCAREGLGTVAFCPLAQGLLTNKYLGGIPADSRAAVNQGNGAIGAQAITPELINRLRALDAIAQQRGQSLAQLAIAWTLRLPAVTTALIGASRPEQIDENVAALANLSFTTDELAAIDAIVA